MEERKTARSSIKQELIWRARKLLALLMHAMRLSGACRLQPPQGLGGAHASQQQPLATGHWLLATGTGCWHWLLALATGHWSMVRRARLLQMSRLSLPPARDVVEIGALAMAGCWGNQEQQ